MNNILSTIRFFSILAVGVGTTFLTQKVLGAVVPPARVTGSALATTDSRNKVSVLSADEHAYLRDRYRARAVRFSH